MTALRDLFSEHVSCHYWPGATAVRRQATDRPPDPWPDHLNPMTAGMAGLADAAVVTGGKLICPPDLADRCLRRRELRTWHASSRQAQQFDDHPCVSAALTGDTVAGCRRAAAGSP